MAVAFAVLGFFRYGATWRALVKEDVAVFASEHDAGYARSESIRTGPAISSLKRGERVAVLWDTYGKDYWACYVRSSTNRFGWVLCPSLQRV